MKTKKHVAVIRSEIKFPFIESFAEEHWIESEKEDLCDLGFNCRALGLGYFNGYYYGVFYIKGEPPTAEEIASVLEKKHGIHKEELSVSLEWLDKRLRA